MENSELNILQKKTKIDKKICFLNTFEILSLIFGKNRKKIFVYTPYLEHVQFSSYIVKTIDQHYPKKEPVNHSYFQDGE